MAERGLFNSHSTDHGRGQLSYAGLADVFGVYAPSTKAVYLVPINDVGNTEGRLRLVRARNNQQRRVRFAADYEIDRWTTARLRKLASAAALVVAGERAA